MSAEELEDWLKTDESTGAGWKNSGDTETVGHESGTKIVDILKRNPKKEADKYTEEDLGHMRKVWEASLRTQSSSEFLNHKS